MKLGKKLLSLLTVLCLTLSLLPTMALADGDVGVGGPPNRETSVTVGSATLNSNTPYLVKDKTAAQQTITSEEESQGYIQFTSNGQITLNNYAGSSEINATSDLTINLVGKNTITTSGANSIYSTGALTITSDSKGSLTAENLTSGSVQTTIFQHQTLQLRAMQPLLQRSTALPKRSTHIPRTARLRLQITLLSLLQIQITLLALKTALLFWLAIARAILPARLKSKTLPL